MAPKPKPRVNLKLISSPTTSELALGTTLTPRHLLRLREEGTLVGVLLGKHVVWSDEAIEVWLTEKDVRVTWIERAS